MTMHRISISIASMVLATLLGCDNQQDNSRDSGKRKGEPSANTEQESHVPAPFKYELIDTEETTDMLGPQVVVQLETTNEVARKAKKTDVRQLWKHLAPVLGDHRAFLYLRTPVPGALPWAVMSRIHIGGEWRVELNIYEMGIDAEPFHFVNVIDRSVTNQQRMIVTLPMVNRLNEQVINLGWKVTKRDENFYQAETSNGIQSVSLTLGPESVDIQALSAEGNSFLDTVALAFDELGIADELKKKLYSVIGSPEYIRADSRESAIWNWTIGDVDVMYIHSANVDDLHAGYAQ